MRARAEPVVTVARPTAFEDVDIEADTLPLYVWGRLRSGPADPLSLAVSVNGVIAATTLSYRENGEWVFGSMIPQDTLIAGDNDVEIFVVDRFGDELVLRPASRGRRGAERPTAQRD